MAGDRNQPRDRDANAPGGMQKPTQTQSRPDDVNPPESERKPLSEGRKFDDASEAPESGDKKTTGNE